MNAIAHTPPPWDFARIDRNWFAVSDVVGNRIAALEVAEPATSERIKTVAADARLVAASPTLLKAAQYCHKVMRDHVEVVDRVSTEMLASAIELATGERP